MKLMLTSVFGPYGVDDEYGEKENKMAQTVRERSPESKIILGGHGVNIPDIEAMIDHDLICKGEGRLAESSNDAEASSKVTYRWSEQPEPSLAADHGSRQEPPLKRVA